MKSDLFYLDHIIQSLLKIKEYTRDVEFRAFVGDEEKQDDHEKDRSDGRGCQEAESVAQDQVASHPMACHCGNER